MKHAIALILLLSFADFAQAAGAGKTAPKLQKNDKILSDVTYACLGNSAAGLNWDGSQWQATRFQPYEKFLMTVTEIQSKSLNKKFILFVLKGDAVQKDCEAELDEAKAFVEGAQQCLQNGMTVYFVPANGRGGVSYLLGSSSTVGSRDSLSVMPFTCERF